MLDVIVHLWRGMGKGPLAASAGAGRAEAGCRLRGVAETALLAKRHARPGSGSPSRLPRVMCTPGKMRTDLRKRKDVGSVSGVVGLVGRVERTTRV